MSQNFTIDENQANMRIDRYIRKQYQNITQSNIEKLLRKKDIKVNNNKVKSNHILSEGDEVFIYPDLSKFNLFKADKKQNKFNAELLEKLIINNIIYQDKDIIAINKPSGLASQGGSGIYLSLDDFMHFLADKDNMYKAGLKKHYLPNRPKLLHRIDKDTSGVIILAKNDPATRKVGQLFKDKEVHKEYIAVIKGLMRPFEGSINQKILAKADSSKGQRSVIDNKEGRYSVTNYNTIDEARKISLVMAIPETGRMHQIRVHFAHHNCPIIGDGKYGGKEAYMESISNKMHLHAYQISFTIDRKEYKIKAPIPKHIEQTCKFFGFDYNL